MAETEQSKVEMSRQAAQPFSSPLLVFSAEQPASCSPPGGLWDDGVPLAQREGSGAAEPPAQTGHAV